MEDVAALVEDNADGKLSADQMVSPTREAKLKWQTSLLGAGMHYGGPRIVAIADEVMAITARLFHLCDSAKSIRLGEFGAHLASLLCGAVTGTYVVDLFAPEDARDDPDAELPARWVVSKVRDGEDGTPDLGENFLPEPFAWRRPSEDELAVARRAAKAFIDAPAGELVAAFGPGGDGALGKERVRAALASIGGVAGGFRTRMADFAPEPARHHGDEPPRPVAIRDARRRRLARRRVRSPPPASPPPSPGRAPTIPRRWVWRCRWRRISWRPRTAIFTGVRARYEPGTRTLPR